MTVNKPSVNFVFLSEEWTSLLPHYEKEISYAFEKVAKQLGKDFSETEVSVVFADDKEMQALNKTFRHQDKPTNVLSFPSDEEGELGDIILAYETILREAQEKKISFLHHTVHLIVHGFLHLLGYDHEKEHEAHRMEIMEIKILKDMNISNPYEDL